MKTAHTIRLRVHGFLHVMPGPARIPCPTLVVFDTLPSAVRMSINDEAPRWYPVIGTAA